MTILRPLALVVFLTACGGPSNLELRVVPGQSRATAEKTLKSTKYCRHEGSEKATQSYVRCDVKGFELGESWIVVDYSESETVSRVRRMEHYRTHEAATERFNELVASRANSLGEESLEARQRLAEYGEAPMGSVVWKTWLSKGLDQVIGVYLVKSSDPKDPQVVEVIRWDKPE